MKLILIIIIALFKLNGICQNTIQFKGQVFHNKLGPQKNIAILIDNTYPAVTNDAGVFKIALPKSTHQIKVTLTNSVYAILYPYGGFVLLPRNENDVPQIIVGNVKENDYLQQYLSLYKLVKNKPVATSPDLAPLKKKMDSLQALLIKLHYTEAELKSAKEIQDGKDDYLPEITADLAEYKTKAIDLKTAFKYVADYAFENSTALERLVTAINSYNTIFSKLDRQHINYEKRISEYWQSDSLRNTYRSLISLALDTIHVQKIYPMQNTIGQIRDYFVNKNKNNEIKSGIQQQIKKLVAELEVYLPRLEERTINFNTQLSS